jgi:hypothetical protein
MSQSAPEKIHGPAAIGGVVVAVAVHAVGAALDWWEAGALAVFPILGFGLATGWLFARRKGERT